MNGKVNLLFFFCLALHSFWSDSCIILGRKGIGLGKRARSPSAAERLAKMAKMAEEMDHRDFRERARDDYNNRRAEGRLGVYPDRFTPPCFNFIWFLFL